MSRPVSIIVWRDAKSDPPKGGGGVFAYFADLGRPVSCSAEELRVTASAGDLWAELPVVSDLTDEDVRYAVEAYEKKALSSGAVDMRPFRARVDRLRAALGGEKEEA